MTNISQSLRLNWQILLHGKYSYKTNEFCQRNNLVPPYNLCYTEIPLDHLMLFIKKDSNIPDLPTTLAIRFKEEEFGSSLKSFTHRNPKPECYTVQKTMGHEIRVYGYRRKLYSKRDKELFYFVDGQFIMGEVVIPQSQLLKKEIIYHALREKYNLGEDMPEQDKFYVHNNDGHILLFDDNGFTYSVRYFDSSFRILQEAWKNYQKSIFEDL